MKTCDLQDLCVKYKRGTLPPNNHVRLTEPCDKFIKCDCEMYMYWMNWQGTPISCKVKK